MPKPNNITELKAFIVLINYYGSFIKKLSGLLRPLHDLLKNTSFKWSKECEVAFKRAKAEFERKQ